MYIIKTFLFLFLLLSASSLYASDTYTSSQPLESRSLQQQYAGCCSYEDNYKYWNQLVRLPLGTTLDRVQIAGQSVSGTTVPLTIYLFQDNGSLFDSCNSTSCDSTDTQISTIYSGQMTEVNDTTLESSSFTPITITQSNYYLMFHYAGSYTYTFDQGFYYNTGVATTCFTGTYGGTTCPSSNKILGGVSFKTCSGSCTTTGFSGVPDVTPEPWARMVSPVDGNTVGYTVPFQFYINWGTSTDNAIIRYDSNFQSIIPDTITAVSSGLYTFTPTKNFPAIPDTLQISIELLSGSTSVYISPDYTINLTDTSDPNAVINSNTPTACLNTITGYICSIANFLFVPSSFTTSFLSSSMDTIKTKKPFSYFTQTSTIISNAASSTSSTDFINLEITVYGMTLPIITQSSLDAIYPETTRLYIKSVIAYGLWIAFALTLIYMVLNIFNRVAYQGEQQQAFENRVKTKHER